MTKERVFAEVKLRIEAAREIDINRHVSNALIELDAIGLETTRGIITTIETVVTDPALRTSLTAGNYYPDLRCLILPTTLLFITDVFYEQASLTRTTMYQYQTGTMPTLSYVLTDAHEMFLSFDLAEADVIQVSGRWAIRNLELLPDRYENWLLNYVLAGMYSSKLYKDPDQFALCETRRLKAWQICRGSKTGLGEFIAKDGILE